MAFAITDVKLCGLVTPAAKYEIARMPMYRVMLQLTAGRPGVDRGDDLAPFDPAKPAEWLQQFAFKTGCVDLVKTLIALLAGHFAANKSEAEALPYLRMLLEMRQLFMNNGVSDMRGDEAYPVAMKHLKFPAGAPHNMTTLRAQAEHLAAAHGVDAGRLLRWLPLAFAITAQVDMGEKAYGFVDEPSARDCKKFAAHVKHAYQRFHDNMGLVNQQCRAAVSVLVKMAEEVGGNAAIIANLMWQYQAYEVVVAGEWVVVSAPFAFDVTKTDLDSALVRVWARRVELHAARK